MSSDTEARIELERSFESDIDLLLFAGIEVCSHLAQYKGNPIALRVHLKNTGDQNDLEIPSLDRIKMWVDQAEKHEPYVTLTNQLPGKRRKKGPL